jgi:hypothetical protein
VVDIDPRLKSKLNAALAEENIKAVFTITEQPNASHSGVQTGTNPVEEILKRTERVTHEKPANYKYYSKLGVLMIEATTRFIRELVENPEISTAALAKEDDVFKV